MGRRRQRERAWAVGSVHCPVCGWRFYRDRSLEEHIARFHPEHSSQSGHELPQAPTDGADGSPVPGPRMRRRWRVLAGIGAFLWIPVMVLAVVVASADSGQEEAPALATIVGILFIPAWLAGVAAIVLMLRHVYTETGLSIGWRTAWTVFLLLLNLLAAPVYFLRHMAKSSTPGQQQASKRSFGAPEQTASVGGATALDALAAKLSRAPEVPLTGSVRLDPNDVAALVGAIREVAQNAGEGRRAEELGHLILAGPRVPFTHQVRVHRRKALRLIEDLRSALESAQP